MNYQTFTNYFGKAILTPRCTASLDPEATYVISGGLGGLGRKIAVWLADHGARCLLLLSRSGCETPEAQQLVHELDCNECPSPDSFL